MMGSADKPFIVVREEALCLMCEEEDRVVLMRSVKKATPALSVPSAYVSVVDSVADMMCVGGVVLGDGGLSCGGVGGVGLCASRACCCDAMVGPSAELVSEQAGLAVSDAMVGPSAELDFTQAGFADCDTVVDVCDVAVCGGDTAIEGLCDGDMVSGRSDTVGCCVDTVAVIEGLCEGDRVSGVGDTVRSAYFFVLCIRKS